METNLKAIVREGIGSSESKRLRKDGNIPAVVYGLGMDPLSVSVNESVASVASVPAAFS